MTAWPAEQMAAHGGLGYGSRPEVGQLLECLRQQLRRVGILAVVLLPALEAALPVIGALLPGQTAVVLGGMLAWQGHVTVEAALLTAPVGAVLGNLAGYAVGRRWKGRVPAPLQAGAGRHRYTERALGLIERRGAGAVFVGRFTAVLRTGVAPARGDPDAVAAPSAVVRGQQRGVGPGVRADRLCHRVRRTRAPRRRHTQPPAPRQSPATRNAGPGTPDPPTMAVPAPALQAPNPPSRPGVREDRHRTRWDR
ncbi:DedA family protein [Streptomyces canus]|uniref:DedA family protein n=1 Tax=Streptomyces canus TaxID=58343 RepID=UPI00339F105C